MDPHRKLRLDLATDRRERQRSLAPLLRPWPLALHRRRLVLAIRLFLGLGPVSLRALGPAPFVWLDLGSGRSLGAFLGFLPLYRLVLRLGSPAPPLPIRFGDRIHLAGIADQRRVRIRLEPSSLRIRRSQTIPSAAQPTPTSRFEPSPASVQQLDSRQQLHRRRQQHDRQSGDLSRRYFKRQSDQHSESSLAGHWRLQTDRPAFFPKSHGRCRAGLPSPNHQNQGRSGLDDFDSSSFETQLQQVHCPQQRATTNRHSPNVARKR